ncbi:MAG: SDR family oxidoreductase [Enhygromyxa sp.]
MSNEQRVAIITGAANGIGRATAERHDRGLGARARSLRDTEMIARTPVGRIGAPADIARAYLFLADEAAGFISGTVLSVDGGMVVGT